MSAEVRETHISHVFLVGARAYKLLKPVKTSFLDFSDRATRLVAAERELELNRRMAPDVYLGLGDIHEHGEVVDRMIVMRRMPTDRRLSALVGDAHFGDHVRAVAKAVATLHANADPVPVDRARAVAGRDALGRNWADNFADLEAVVGSVIDRADHDEAMERVRQFLAGHVELFDRRLAQGWVRDGHGDLLADDIFCLDDGPRILDCLAFADDLRVSDVLADIGFLAMDLHRLAGPVWARRLMEWYGEFTNEHHPAALAHHYVAYRAHVRAKVAALRLAQGTASAADDVRVHHDLVLHHLRRGRVRMVLVGGTPGTGKTTVAAGVGEALGAVVLSSDELRPAVVGDDRPRTEPDRGRYQPAERARVYDELLRDAERLLAAGVSVVVDASWSDVAERQRAEGAARHHAVDVEAIECIVDVDTAVERVRARLAAGEGSSEATPEVATMLRERWPPWSEAWQLDTSGAPDEAVSAAVAYLCGDDPVR